VNMVDIAPTIAALLGTNIPASNQGHVLINMLSLPSERTVAIQNALKAQQTHCHSRSRRNCLWYPDRNGSGTPGSFGK
jgi:hypothetical protein